MINCCTVCQHRWINGRCILLHAPLLGVCFSACNLFQYAVASHTSCVEILLQKLLYTLSLQTLFLTCIVSAPVLIQAALNLTDLFWREGRAAGY
uniref:Uncharacterized protein n=1 Tax=Arundo donax TaxID=35708 RepID=A0A0A8ZEG6_ARUDO